MKKIYERNVTENNARNLRAKAYLVDLIKDNSDDEHLDEIQSEIYGNELKLEILRQQKIVLNLLKNENENDSIFLSDSVQLMHDSLELKTKQLFEARGKFADELILTRKLMLELHELSSSKEIDIKIKKFSELSSAFVDISNVLSNNKMLNILSIIAQK